MKSKLNQSKVHNYLLVQNLYIYSVLIRCIEMKWNWKMHLNLYVNLKSQSIILFQEFIIIYMFIY